MAVNKKPRKKYKNKTPLGFQEVDIETFIAGIDNAYQAGEFDEELEEQELVPSKNEEGRRKEDTIYDVLLNVFYDAAKVWEARSKDTGNPSRFILSIRPIPKPEGNYAGVVSMSMGFVFMGKLTKVCEKFYGLKTMADLQQDAWKVSLIQEMITELFGMSSMFIQAKTNISYSDVAKVQIKKGEAKRKNND